MTMTERRAGQCGPRASRPDCRIELVGRSEERRSLGDLVDAVARRHSRVLVVRGEAGIGKSALVEFAIGHAPFEHIAIDGVEAEAPIGYAALERLLRPHLSRIVGLPTPQRRALEVAVGLVTGEPADTYLVGLATLSLLADVASGRPLLCTIDDAHWLDHESAKVLAFVARRLQAEALGLVIATRTTENDPFRGLPTMRLEGLADDEARALLAGTAIEPLDQPLAARLVADAAGNPLALLEAASSLADRDAPVARWSTSPLPIGQRLEHHFLTQVRQLPEPTGTFLLLVAAETGRDPSTVWQAAATLDITDTDIDHAFTTDLVVGETSVRFRHPLIRAAVYNGATTAERRRCHEALAEVTDPDSDPERHAWHRAMTVVGLDDDVAELLERAARRARQRGGWSGESELLEMSARLTTDDTVRAKRLLRAARAAVNAGMLLRAERLLDHVDTTGLGPSVEARLLQLRGAVLRESRPAQAVPVLLAAAATCADVAPDAARRALLEAYEAEFMARAHAPGAQDTDIAGALHATHTATRPADAADRLLEAFTTRAAQGYPVAVPLLRAAVDAVDAEPQLVDRAPSLSLLAGAAAGDLWDLDTRHRVLTRAVEASRTRGALPSLRSGLLALGDNELRSGRFPAAEAHFAEVANITQALNDDIPEPGALAVMLHAWRGEVQQTRDGAAALRQIAAATGAGSMRNLAHSALCIAELGAARYGAALDAARVVYTDDPPSQGNAILSDLVEASIRSGDAVAAEQALDRLSGRATASGSPWATGVLARSRALLASETDAATLFDAALEDLARSTATVELARTHLLYGEWLRQHDHPRDARDQLLTAHKMLTDIGANGFAERARRELSATGEQTHQHHPRTMLDLTDQEAEVARRAAGGATNSEIAADMFLSAATVDYHLRKIYRKLGIRSRRQLPDALEN